MPELPQILGGSIGGFVCGFSGSIVNGGRNTGSLFFILPLPVSFAARDSQHGPQMSYSLPSISFCRHSFAWPQRSQVITGPPLSNYNRRIALPAEPVLPNRLTNPGALSTTSAAPAPCCLHPQSAP